MKIRELSIADLKAAYDFTKEFIEEMKQKAADKKVKTEDIPAYRENVRLENDLYNELLNRLDDLK
jgi:hypothetical protein